MTNEDILIYATWTLIAILAVVIIGWALYVGLHDRDKSSLLYWRRVKLVSSLLGVVGLALLMLSFDQLVRDHFRVESREYSADRFYEAIGASACGYVRKGDDRCVTRVRRTDKRGQGFDNKQGPRWRPTEPGQ